MLALLPATAFPHAGEDHSEPKPPATASMPTGSNGAAMPGAAGEAAQRLADGSLYVPKAVQRRLALRTQVAAPAEHAAIVELNGRVIADPGRAGLVQAMQPGRFVAPTRMPALGARVARGDLLGWLAPAAAPLERAGRAAELADARAQLAAAERRVERLAQLDGVVPAKEIELARIERDGLQQKVAALAAGVDAREALRAPVSGLLAAVSVQPGQVVDARQTLYEIVDPQGLAVEALAYDAALLERIGEATTTVAATTLRLAYAGGGRSLRDGALPIRFRVQPPAAGAAMPPLALNQPLKIFVGTSQRLTGVAMPAEAIGRNNAGESIVWLHSSAERFSPARVKTQSLDGRRVVVVDGLPKGARVVVEGAALLSQIR